MEVLKKEWLVRTRSGEILGPFDSRELVDSFQRGQFYAEDEIASSMSRWISAQSLLNRERDEFTTTRTKNQTVTRSAASGATAEAYQESEQTETETPSFSQPVGPKFIKKEIYIVPPPQADSAKISASMTPRLWPVFLLLGGIFVSWLIFHSQRKVEIDPKLSQYKTNGLFAEAESPFVGQVMGMIQTGERQAALRLLAQHHEKHSGSSDVEYLIPYAALLITEGDSPARARKLLEQVLSSQAVASIRAKAHHWLGYLSLLQGDGDFGENHFLEELQLTPKNAAARFNLGRAYLAQEKFAKSLEYFQLAEHEMPDLWLIHIYKGRVKAALGNMDEANASLKKALELDPERWSCYLYYALVLQAMRAQDQAQNVLRKMLMQDPQYDSMNPYPWGFFEDRVSFSEYIETFEDVMGKAYGEERELGKLYLYYLSTNSGGAEGKRIELVADKGGTFARVLALKVALDKEAPLDVLKQRLQQLPGGLKDFGYYAYVLRAEAKARLGFYQESALDFQTALQLEPGSAIARWLYSALLKKMHKSADYQNEIKNLLSYHPNYIPAIIAARAL